MAPIVKFNVRNGKELKIESVHLKGGKHDFSCNSIELKHKTEFLKIKIKIKQEIVS